jgi:hypothetical protein
MSIGANGAGLALHLVKLTRAGRKAEEKRRSAKKGLPKPEIEMG